MGHPKKARDPSTLGGRLQGQTQQEQTQRYSPTNSALEEGGNCNPAAKPRRMLPGVGAERGDNNRPYPRMPTGLRQWAIWTARLRDPRPSRRKQLGKPLERLEARHTMEARDPWTLGGCRQERTQQKQIQRRGPTSSALTAGNSHSLAAKPPRRLLGVGAERDDNHRPVDRRDTAPRA